MTDDVAPQAEPHPPDRPDEEASEILVIDEERGLIRHRKAIVARLKNNPQAMRMLVINPVLAFRDAGIKLSPAVANHVLHAIQYPPRVRAERDRLEDELKEALGAPARPTVPTWLAQTVFGKLGVTPMEIGDHEPAYRSTFDAQTLARLEALLPTRGVVTIPTSTGEAPVPGGTPGRFSFEPKSLQLLDLDAPVPPLPPAASAPSELSVTNLWFYKDAAPVVRSLLSLGILIMSGVAIYSSGQYRKISAGDAESELLAWITTVRVPSGK